MLLSQAIKEIFGHITDEFVITSTGHISREAFVYDRPRNFYMQGSMGCALAIGLGVALNAPWAKVVVISGDGAVLMSLGTLALHAELLPFNLKHIVIDNGCYGSTGGQKTARLVFTGANTDVVKVDYSKCTAPRITLPCREISRRFRCELLQARVPKS